MKINNNAKILNWNLPLKHRVKTEQNYTTESNMFLHYVNVPLIMT